MGNYHHKKFRSQNLGTVSKKTDWENLLKFLMQELRLREQMVLDNKTAKLMGFESKNDKPPKDQKTNIWDSANFGAGGETA